MYTIKVVKTEKTKVNFELNKNRVKTDIKDYSNAILLDIDENSFYVVCVDKLMTINRVKILINFHFVDSVEIIDIVKD